ncbi:TadE/TadG family type IV pilus assembly protein [Rhizobium sp. CAU 1783]
MRLHQRLLRDEKGAAAIEFALLAMPFLMLVFAILEVSLMFFIDSGLDSALQRTAREVRTGAAASNSWDLQKFKARVCENMTFSFGCSDTLLVSTQVMSDFSSRSYKSGVQNGVLSVQESFSPGGSGDYVLIQAYLPWDSTLAFAGIKAHTLQDGRYVLAAAALFRNEPF